MDMTRPSSGHDQAVDPTKIHHPEEEEHHESGASKMFRKAKARAKKFKNSLTKQDNEKDHDVDEEADEIDEQEPEKHGAQVHESSNVRGGVTGQPESLSHPPETKVPAPEEIIPPGEKVFPVVSSNDTKPVEPEPSQDASYGHEAPSHPVRLSDISERDESKEAHHVPLNTPASLLSTTEDVKRPFAPDEDEDLGGQREVNTETPQRLEEDLGGESNYQSKVTNPTEQGIAESLDRMEVTDESRDQKSKLGLEIQEFERESESGIGKDSPTRFRGETGAEVGKDFPARRFEFEQKTESGIDKNYPTGFGGESGAGQRDGFLAKSHEFDQEIESGIAKDSPTGFCGESETGMREDFPAKSHEFEQTIESGIAKDTRLGGKPGTEKREDFVGKGYEFDREIESAIGKDSPTRFGGESESGIGEEIPARSHELGVNTDSGTGKDSSTGSHGYGEESEAGKENFFPARSDVMKVENVFGRDLPTGTHDQFSPELSRPKDRNDFDDSQAEETREETQEPKPTTYTEQVGSATSFKTDKAIAAKNGVASRLGYSGETTGTGGQHESPVGVETPGTVAEKLTPDEETGSPVTKKLPLSGGGNGAEKTEEEEDKGVSTKDYLAEKVKPGEKDKAMSEMITEKLNLGGGEKTTATKEEEVAVEKIPSHEVAEEKEQGEAVAGEEKVGGGMVGKIKGAYSYWLGGSTEEVKPKSPVSGEESSQSLGSTVGTKGFPDSGESGLGETTGGGSGAVPVQRGL